MTDIASMPRAARTNLTAMATLLIPTLLFTLLSAFQSQPLLWAVRERPLQASDVIILTGLAASIILTPPALRLIFGRARVNLGSHSLMLGILTGLIWQALTLKAGPSLIPTIGVLMISEQLSGWTARSPVVLWAATLCCMATNLAVLMLT